tara:strand:+ start:81 stop:935 length:855 start_codon:yes stop_codon:yes gene_type:complete
MNLVQLLTPKNEDGSIDQRYSSITATIVDQIGKQAANGLLEFYNKSFELEKRYGGYALQLVVTSFSIDQDEYQQKRMTKSLRTALQELGFKPSNVSKLLSAGRFLGTYDLLEETFCYFGRNTLLDGQQAQAKLDEYFNGFTIGLLDVISRTRKQGRKKAYSHYAMTGKRMSQAELEEVRRQYPLNPDERRGHKSQSHDSAKSSDLAKYESLTPNQDTQEELQSPDQIIGNFIDLFETEGFDNYIQDLDENQQLSLMHQLMDAANLLAEYVACQKNIVDVTPILN